jgi:hypothetical protein
MSKDFDSVDFNDYKSDMDELGTQAAQVISALKQELDRERRDKDRLLATVVIAAGGRVEISSKHLMDTLVAEVKMWRDEANKVTVIEVVSREESE